MKNNRKSIKPEEERADLLKIKKRLDKIAEIIDGMTGSSPDGLLKQLNE